MTQVTHGSDALNDSKNNLISLHTGDYTQISSGTFILISKPFGWTSFDVVNKLRGVIKRILQVKKYKIGHAGTLDPFASGLLIIGASTYTKKISEVQLLEKSYIATMTLGATTPSYDRESPIDAHYPIDHITESDIQSTLLSFVGEIDQRPPIFSAVKIDGSPAYKAARKGKTIEMPIKRVNIHDIQLISCDMPDVAFSVRCSKGTYVRSLVHDVGLKLKSGAHLKDLERTAIGPYTLDNALTIEQFIERIKRAYDH